MGKAFQSGYRKAEASGRVVFLDAKNKMLKQFEQENAGSDLIESAEAKSAKKAQERRKKKQSNEAVKAKARANEVADKRVKHQEAITLSQRVTQLVSSEAARKAQQRKAMESSGKQKEKEVNDELATKSGERGEKA